MSQPTSFSERLARIEARARQGQNTGAVAPGPHDPDAQDVTPGPALARSFVRVAFGGIAMLAVTATAFVGGLWILLPQEDATALGIVARDIVMEQLPFGQDASHENPAFGN